MLREEWTLDVSQSFVPIDERKKLRLRTPAWKTPATGGLSFAEKIRARKYTPYAGCGNDIEAEEEEAGEEEAGEEETDKNHDNNEVDEEEKKKKIFSSAAMSSSTASSSSSSSSASSSSGQILMTACDGTAIKMEDEGDEEVVVKKVAEHSAVIPAHTLPAKKPRRA